MLSRLILSTVGLLVAGTLVGCQDGALDPYLEEGAEIRLHVSGGIAGVDYRVVLNGADGKLVAEGCTSGCDFAPGELLTVLTAEEVQDLFGLFRSAGIYGVAGTDFGTLCCDQFHYDLTYRDHRGESEVRGSSEALPPELDQAVAAVTALVSGPRPLVVDLSGGADRWPTDPLEIHAPGIEGDELSVRVSYGGGCRAHLIRGVAYGGFMESRPVQVRVLLSHEDYDDPCDAWITRDLRFDLTPLRRAYEEAYGPSPTGETVLKVLLDDPRLASPLGAWVLDYTF